MTTTTGDPARRRVRVAFWNNVPSPYMVARFNAAARYASRIEFEAWFNQRTAAWFNRAAGADLSWAVDESAWEFSYRYLPQLRRGDHRLTIPTVLMSRKLPDVVVSLYAEPVFTAGLIVLHMRGVRTAARVLKTWPAWVPRRTWRTQLRRQLFRRLDGFVTSGPDGRDFAIDAGAAPKRIAVLPQAFDVQWYSGARALRHNEGPAIRNALGLDGFVFLYVGRLHADKGVLHLMDAFSRLPVDGRRSSQLLLVGDGPAVPELRTRAARDCPGRVVFTGFREGAALLECYAAADAFVFPTLGDPYGLVVDEAFAAGLPVISTECAGEIRDRVHDGSNGFVVPAADPDAMADRMRALVAGAAVNADTPGTRAFLDGHTPRRWAEDFEKLVLALHEAPAV